MRIQSVSLNNYRYKTRINTKTNNQTFKGKIYLDTQGYKLTDMDYQPIKLTINELDEYGVTCGVGRNIRTFLIV